VGSVVRVDLLTDEPEAAAQFYRDVLGWETEATMDPAFQLLRSDGVTIGHIVNHEPEDPNESEVQWLVSLAVRDLAALDVESAGGSVYLAPEPGPHGERLSVIGDPEGAPVVLVEPAEGEDESEDVLSRELIWVELLSENRDRTSSFFQSLIGYEQSVVGDGDGYMLLTSAGQSRAGVVNKPWPDVAPSWLIYVLVTDLPQILESARLAGGSVLLPPSKSLAGGRVAILQDPTGGVFAVQERYEP
jgi:predicted enzyme related to lactoylglutathione lyase